MSYPRVRFVTAPDPAATVLLDLHTEVAGARMWPRSDGWDLGAPTLEGASDGVAVSYGDRVLSFTQVVEGPKSVALARQSQLARLLLRPEGWLEFTLSAATAPVWFQLRYAEPQSLSFDQVRNDSDVDRWAIGMRLPAAAFAQGELVSLGPFDLVNDPVDDTPNMVIVDGVIGDAPAPALIRFRYGASQLGRRHMLATSPVPDGFDAPIWWQAGTGDGWTLGADTTAAGSAAYVGGLYRPVSFATTPGMATRVSGEAPYAVPPGQYKILARVARSDTDTTFAVRLGLITGFVYTYSETIPLSWNTSAAGHAAWVDLGEFRLPQSAALVDLVGEADVVPDIAFQAERLAGDGSLNLNGFLLIPVDDENARTLFVDYPDLAPAAVFDDEYHDTVLAAVYSRRPLSEDALTTYIVPPALQGGFPVLVPGERTALHWVEQTSTSRAATFYGDYPDRVTSSAEVVVSYHPQFLYIGDGS